MLPNAVVRAERHEDVARLADLCREHDCRWVGGEETLDENDNWNSYESETAYFIENNSISYASVSYAEIEYRDDPYYDDVRPTDPRFFLCSTDEYIALVNGETESDPIMDDELLDALL